MQTVEERKGTALEAGGFTQSPLQIRMNPFVAPIKRAADFDARVYLGERADSMGQSDLLAPDAANLMIEVSGGAPRALRGIAQLAFFAAASERASRIDCRHVAGARDTWVAQNGEPPGAKPRLPEMTARVYAAPAQGAKAEPAPAAAPPAAPQSSPVAAIRREVTFSVKPQEPMSPKRQWVRRAVEATAAFVALFALVGLISSQVTGSNLRGIKRSAALPAVSDPADLTTTVIETPVEPVQQAAEKPAAPASALTKPTPVAATPVRKPVENATAEDPALDQVPTEDHIKSENP